MISLPIFNQIVYQTETSLFTNPLPGNPWSHFIADTNVRTILCMSWALITGAAVGNRQMQLAIQNNASGFIHEFTSPVLIPPSTTTFFSAFAGSDYVPPVPGLGTGVFPLPAEHYIFPADNIFLIVGGILAADQLFAPLIQFKIWRTEP
jgi:hypothetical protein